jgi:hypothetical protein
MKPAVARPVKARPVLVRGLREFGTNQLPTEPFYSSFCASSHRHQVDVDTRGFG